MTSQILRPHMIFRYEPASHKLETTTYDPDGSLIRRWSYQYNPSKREIAARGYNSRGRLVQKQWTRYDRKGQALEKKVSSPYYLPSQQLEATNLKWNISLRNAYLFDRSRDLWPAWQTSLILGMRTEESFSLNLSTGPWSAYVTQQGKTLGELKQWEWAFDLTKHTNLGQNRIYGGPGIYLLNYRQCKTKLQRDFKTEDTSGFQLRVGWEYPVSQGLTLGLETGYRWSPAVKVLDKPEGIDIDRLDFDAWISALTITHKF